MSLLMILFSADAKKIQNSIDKPLNLCYNKDTPREKKERTDTMAKYLVNVIMSTCVEVEVDAQNEEEARSLAFEEADPFTVDDWDYDIDSMEREDDEEGEDEDL